MKAIHVVGAVSTVVIGAFYLGMVRKRVPAKDRPFMFGLAALTFLMPALAFYGVRQPLDALVRTLLDPQGGAYALARLWYAPVTEELAKLWPLLIPGVWRWIDHDRAPRAAYALGLGFGVGEIAFLAVVFGLDPSAETNQWFHYAGFVSERLMVAPIHAGFVLVSLCAWRRWNWPGGLFVGWLGAAALHFSLNAPIFLKYKGWLGGETLAGNLLVGWILLFFVLTITGFARTLGGRQTTAGGFFFGETDCVLCGLHYQRPFWGFNLGLKRYEKCPGCQKWHLQ
ncbi:MAG: hypothetical protein JSR82_18765 [Verrucomicrobia bacterium]|nr:hypothetical protein [Verrucomicrobiota bacterium]